MNVRYGVVNCRTGECFGNHTHAEAMRRAQIMRRNWSYSERFDVVEIKGHENKKADEN